MYAHLLIRHYVLVAGSRAAAHDSSLVGGEVYPRSGPGVPRSIHATRSALFGLLVSVQGIPVHYRNLTLPRARIIFSPWGLTPAPRKSLEARSLIALTQYSLQKAITE